eukprot:g2426.t1
MAKSLLSSVLQRAFGKYIEGIDAKNLRASVWSGKVSLHNLRLRRSALDALRLPIKLHAGSIARFEVEVPWKHLESAPMRVIIDGVQLLARPLARAEYTADAARRRDAERWRAVLHAASVREDIEWGALEADIAAQLAAAIGDAIGDAAAEHDEGGAEQRGYFARLGARVLAQLRVVLQNAHLRYESAGGPEGGGARFAAGAALTRFEIRNCTPQEVAEQGAAAPAGAGTDTGAGPDAGTAAATGAQPAAVHKLARAEDLFVYWHSGAAPEATEASGADGTAAMFVPCMHRLHASVAATRAAGGGGGDGSVGEGTLLLQPCSPTAWLTLSGTAAAVAAAARDAAAAAASAHAATDADADADADSAGVVVAGKLTAAMDLRLHLGAMRIAVTEEQVRGAKRALAALAALALWQGRVLERPSVAPARADVGAGQAAVWWRFFANALASTHGMRALVGPRPSKGIARQDAGVESLCKRLARALRSQRQYIALRKRDVARARGWGDWVRPLSPAERAVLLRYERAGATEVSVEGAAGEGTAWSASSSSSSSAAAAEAPTVDAVVVARRVAFRELCVEWQVARSRGRGKIGSSAAADRDRLLAEKKTAHGHRGWLGGMVRWPRGGGQARKGAGGARADSADEDEDVYLDDIALSAEQNAELARAADVSQALRSAALPRRCVRMRIRLRSGGSVLRLLREASARPFARWSFGAADYVLDLLPTGWAIGASLAHVRLQALSERGCSTGDDDRQLVNVLATLGGNTDEAVLAFDGGGGGGSEMPIDALRRLAGVTRCGDTEAAIESQGDMEELDDDEDEDEEEDEEDDFFTYGIPKSCKACLYYWGSRARLKDKLNQAPHKIVRWILFLPQ